MAATTNVDKMPLTERRLKDLLPLTSLNVDINNPTPSQLTKTSM